MHDRGERLRPSNVRSLHLGLVLPQQAEPDDSLRAGGGAAALPLLPERDRPAGGGGGGKVRDEGRWRKGCLSEAEEVEIRESERREQQLQRAVLGHGLLGEDERPGLRSHCRQR